MNDEEGKPTYRRLGASQRRQHQTSRTTRKVRRTPRGGLGSRWLGIRGNVNRWSHLDGCGQARLLRPGPLRRSEGRDTLSFVGPEAPGKHPRCFGVHSLK